MTLCSVDSVLYSSIWSWKEYNYLRTSYIKFAKSKLHLLCMHADVYKVCQWTRSDACMHGVLINIIINEYKSHLYSMCGCLFAGRYSIEDAETAEPGHKLYRVNVSQMFMCLRKWRIFGIRISMHAERAKSKTLHGICQPKISWGVLRASCNACMQAVL